MEHDEALPTLAGERVVLRPLRRADAPTLLRILEDPTVVPYWGIYDPVKLERDFYDPAWAYTFIIEVDGHDAGLIQFHEVPDPDYAHAGVDITLDGAHQDRGLGADALKTLIRYLIAERGHHRITIDPAVDNPRAIRAYEKVGFKPVGVMRRYERGADGTWHDNVLMDLLAEEFEGA